jgi:23S rRNA (adenine2030-N6)-methyltransferase
MNYRHAYHAGNYADVLKHVALLAVCDRLNQKPAPCFYLDTHSGRGHYPLGGAETQRAGEFRNGVMRLLQQPSPPTAVARYLAAVSDHGLRDGALVDYPGSPVLAANALRAQDRLALCELEPKEAQALRDGLRHDRRVAIHERDGYEALAALLPPREKRGLILIDPPYEEANEFTRLLEALPATLKRWPTATYMVWYPIKHGGGSHRFLERMQAIGIRRQLVVELTVERDDSPGGLNGSGLLIVNPPWQLAEELALALPYLHEKLSITGHGRWRVEWLVPE